MRSSFIIDKNIFEYIVTSWNSLCVNTWFLERTNCYLPRTKGSTRGWVLSSEQPPARHHSYTLLKSSWGKAIAFKPRLLFLFSLCKKETALHWEKNLNCLLCCFFPLLQFSFSARQGHPLFKVIQFINYTLFQCYVKCDCMRIFFDRIHCQLIGLKTIRIVHWKLM